MSCPVDVNVFNKEHEKLTKYQVLLREVSKCYSQPVDTVPIIFGHSGIVSADQQTYLKRIPGYNENLFNNLQKAPNLTF